MEYCRAKAQTQGLSVGPRCLCEQEQGHHTRLDSQHTAAKGEGHVPPHSLNAPVCFPVRDF